MMKRTLAAMAAAMLLAGVLSGCSGSVSYEDPWTEGNVSTTDDGQVNGTNRDLERGMYPNTNTGRTTTSSANTGRVTTPSTNTSRVTTPGTSTNRGTTSNANTGTGMTPGTSTGTGMTGGR